MNTLVSKVLISLAMSTAFTMVSGMGYMQIQFNTYHNHDSRDSRGTFCDSWGWLNLHASPCDPKFRLMADTATLGGNNLYDYQQAHFYSESDLIHFGHQFGDIPNPVPIAMNYWNPGYLPITVVVLDQDPHGAFDLIDNFYANLYTLADNVRRNLDIYSSPMNHRLSITYWFTCNIHYYGPYCNEHCVPHNDNTAGHYTCDSNGNKVCLTEWSGADCTQLRPCFATPCFNGGTCSDVGGDVKCACTSSFTGSRCEADINECEIDNSLCKNGGTCTNTHGGFNCTCSANFTGSRCEIDVNECEADSSACKNGGTCTNTHGGFNCTCSANFTGSRCETDINECEAKASPCLNGGVCQNLLGGFNCLCPSNFSGSVCSDDVNECDHPVGGPCLNGGTCANSFGEFNCTCPPGFGGSVCETDIDECKTEGNPCQNGGTCSNSYGGFQCGCRSGFTGSRCELDVNECEGAGSGCAAGSTCVNELGTYRCECPAGLSGRFCESSAPESGEPLPRTVIIACSVVGAAILIVTTILSIALVKSGKISQVFSKTRRGSTVEPQTVDNRVYENELPRSAPFFKTELESPFEPMKVEKIEN